MPPHDDVRARWRRLRAGGVLRPTGRDLAEVVGERGLQPVVPSRPVTRTDRGATSNTTASLRQRGARQACRPGIRAASPPAERHQLAPAAMGGGEARRGRDASGQQVDGAGLPNGSSGGPAAAISEALALIRLSTWATTPAIGKMLSYTLARAHQPISSSLFWSTTEVVPRSRCWPQRCRHRRWRAGSRTRCAPARA